MTIIPEQRIYSYEDALSIAIDEAKMNNIDLKFRLMGGIKKTNKELYTFTCGANDNSRQMSFVGGGSGCFIQANVKAAYEALEDTLTHGVFASAKHELIYTFSTNSSPSTPYLQKCGLLPKIVFQEEYLDRGYPWLKLYDLTNKENELYYPLSLIYPYTTKIPQFNAEIDQSDLIELSNETSISIGASYEEAMIHSINEWIERDAYSLFLLQTIIKQQSIPAKVVLHNSLPEDLLEIVAMIETNFNEELIIVDITSDINIPAFLVSFSRQNSIVQPAGFAASLSKHAALQQALLEALQYKDRYNSDAHEFRQAALRHYQERPLLVKAMQCDLLDVVRNGKYIDCSWCEIATYPSGTLSEQLKAMVMLLQARGFNLFYNKLYQGDSGVALVYTMITGLETFFLIKDGKFLPLKHRGKSILTQDETCN